MRGAHKFEDEQAQENRVTGSIAALALVLVLVIASLFLVQTLRHKAALEDCLMSGRISCDFGTR